ncbi:Auxin-responsive protein SAUR15 [Camellia lanceoleosa]|uniref:Auxin-responsive protein SAUR15 n=1 Tax=Camellia lanceoleosa TaxID=1840588 RepID=A0ACC0ISR9_9ERIC|nr:Auxin-responsive protein SAUR15 [Camellia lanceoleosa]
MHPSMAKICYKRDALQRFMAKIRCGSRAPKGHFVVYVGDGDDGQEVMRRFVVPTSYLKDPIFKQLLDKAAIARKGLFFLALMFPYNST